MKRLADIVDSDVEEDMFAHYLTPTDDGVAIHEQPKRPDLTFPSVKGCDGKGWGPRVTNEQAENIMSKYFLNAIAEENWLRVNNLLQYRVNLNFCDDSGWTALHWAISKRHKQLVRFLLGQDVDITCVTDGGQTALHFACAHNDLRLVIYLLHLHWLNGEDNDQTIHKTTKEDGDNALHLAALHGNVRIGKRLIQAGVDFTCKNKTDQTPFSIAETRGHKDFANLIQKHIDLEKQEREAVQKSLELASSLMWRRSTPLNNNNYTQLSMNHFLNTSPPKRRRRHIRFIETDELDVGDNYSEISRFGTTAQEIDDDNIVFDPNYDDRMDADLKNLQQSERKFWESKVNHQEPVRGWDDDWDEWDRNEVEENEQHEQHEQHEENAENEENEQQNYWIIDPDDPFGWNDDGDEYAKDA